MWSGAELRSHLGIHMNHTDHSRNTPGMAKQGWECSFTLSQALCFCNDHMQTGDFWLLRCEFIWLLPHLLQRKSSSWVILFFICRKHRFQFGSLNATGCIFSLDQDIPKSRKHDSYKTQSLTEKGKPT